MVNSAFVQAPDRLSALRSRIAASMQILWTAEADGAIVAEQREWSDFTGQTYEAYRGHGWMAAVHPDDRGRVAEILSRAVGTSSTVEVGYRLRRHDGEYCSFSVRCIPVLDADGKIRAWIGSHTDTASQKLAEEELSLLVSITEVLASPLDHEYRLKSTARMVVAHLADWCGISLVQRGKIDRVATAHRDPAKEATAERLLQFSMSLDHPGSVAQVIRTGKPLLYPEVTDSLRESVTRDPAQGEVLRALGLKSAIVVPLVAGGEVLGAITIVSAESERRYGARELAIAEDLARLMAVAVDNTRLFREAHEARAVMECQTVELELQLEELQMQAMQLEQSQAELEVSQAELQSAHATLTTAEAQLQYVLEASPAVTYTLHMGPNGGSSLWVSANVRRVMGYTAEVALADGWWAGNLHADDRDHAQTAFDRLFEQGELSHRYRFRHRDGTYRWIHDDLRLVRDDSGRPAEIVGSWVDITDRMEAEAALRASTEQFRQLAGSIDGVFWLYDCGEARTIYVNPRFGAVWGHTAEELYENPRIWTEALHPEDRERVIARMNATREQEYEIEYRIIRPDGGIRWIRDRGFPVRDASGRIHRTAGLAEDVTDDKRRAEALRESEEKLRQVTENIREIFWMFDPDFRETIYISPAYEEIWGRSVEGLYEDARSFLRSVHPDDMERVHSEMGGIREGTPVQIEFRLLHPDESVRWVRTRGFPVTDGRGEVYRVVGTTEDITTRKQAEADRAAAEEHYRRLVETSPYAIYALDPEGRFTEVNRAATEILARPAEDLIGRHMSEVLAPGDLPRAVSARNEKFSRAVAHTDQEVWVVRPSGERRLVHVCASLIEQAGVAAGTHGIVRDITEERAREGEMRLLAAALESLNEGVSVMRFDGQLIYANSTHARLLGYDVDGGELPNDRIFVPDEEAQRAADTLRTVAEHGTWSGRVRRRRSNDGRILPVDMILGRVDREGEESVVFNILHDLTDEIQKEQQFRRVERLASVGTMVGGVAHELNNPLHAVRNFAELMLMEPRDERDREALELIRSEADRAAKVVADLRLFARQAQEEGRERERVDLNDVLRHVLQIRRYALETGGIEIVEDLAADLPTIWANRGEVEQVVVNLIANAEEAMIPVAGEKRLVLRTRPGAVGATVHVGDSGTGIPTEHLERIFDPFFTTKPPRNGTGLGLSLVHTIVHEHGGGLLVESEVGKGTIFRIDLPGVPTSGGDRVPDEAIAPVHHRPLRILLVDDEEALRRSGARYFTSIGHHIDVAGEGAEALRLLESGNYDVIISDLRMPGMGGEMLLQRLRERGDGLERRVVFVTGEAASTPAVHALSIAGVPVLVKPVDLQAIAQAVEKVASVAELEHEVR